MVGQMKFFTLVIAAVMIGCGGSGGGDSVTAPQPQTPTISSAELVGTYALKSWNTSVVQPVPFAVGSAGSGIGDYVVAADTLQLNTDGSYINRYFDCYNYSPSCPPVTSPDGGSHASGTWLLNNGMLVTGSGSGWAGTFAISKSNGVISISKTDGPMDGEVYVKIH